MSHSRSRKGRLVLAVVSVFAAVMAMELVSFMALRFREPYLPRPFRVPGGWWIAAPLCALPVACATMSIVLKALEQNPDTQETSVWEVVGKALPENGRSEWAKRFAVFDLEIHLRLHPG